MPPTASNTGSGASSGLSQSDKIALGVGLGVGIPPIVLALISDPHAAQARVEIKPRETSAHEIAPNLLVLKPDRNMTCVLVPS